MSRMREEVCTADVGRWRIGHRAQLARNNPKNQERFRTDRSTTIHNKQRIDPSAGCLLPARPRRCHLHLAVTMPSRSENNPPLQGAAPSTTVVATDNPPQVLIADCERAGRTRLYRLYVPRFRDSLSGSARLWDCATLPALFAHRMCPQTFNSGLVEAEKLAAEMLIARCVPPKKTAAHLHLLT